MPCWEVRTMCIEFEAKHLELLKKAIKALGWNCEDIASGLRVKTADPAWTSFTIDLVSQKAEIRTEQQPLLNQLKQQYSKEALKRAARLRGWQFKQQGQERKGVLRK